MVPTETVQKGNTSSPSCKNEGSAVSFRHNGTVNAKHQSFNTWANEEKLCENEPEEREAAGRALEKAGSAH